MTGFFSRLFGGKKKLSEGEDAVVEVVESVLAGLIEKADLDLSFEIKSDDQGLVVELSGGDADQLKEREGELIEAFQLFMKRVLTEVGKDCYYLGPAFRNSEPESSRHSGEFVMLEYYKLGASYMDLADELLNLLQALSHVAGPLTIDSKPYSFDTWEVLTVDEAFVRYAGLEKNTIFEAKAFVTAARAMGYTTDGFSYEDLFTQMYVDQVEPHLGTAGRPTLLKDYPREFAALAALNNDGKTAKRFEFYIGGVELGDCYSELTDAVVQKRRFLAEQKKRIDQGLIEHPVDWGFITMLEKGLPDCAGIAIGFERLAMVLLGAESIHDLRLVDVV
jgi:elongation factor P--beta-lysine ligase